MKGICSCDTLLFESKDWVLLKCKDHIVGGLNAFVAHVDKCGKANTMNERGIRYIPLHQTITIEGVCECGVPIDPDVLKVWYLYNFDEIAKDDM